VLTGPTELTPSQLWFFEQDFEDIDHWNGMWPLLSVAEQLDPMLLGAALHKVMVHHDMLRARFTRNSAGWSAAIIAPDELGPVPLSTFDYSDLSGADLERAVEETCERCQASLSLSDGPTLRVSYFDLGEGRSGRLHVAAHWVTLDYYSSRIFFEDLQSAYLQLRRGEDPLLPAKTTPFPLFSQQLIERSNDHDVIEELVEWMSAERAAVAPIPLDHDLGPNRQATARRVMISLPVGQTRALVGSARRDYGCEVREMILTALARALANFTGQSAALVEIEAHGRDQMILGADMSRSVGRTSTLWPAYLDVDQADDAAQAIARVVERMRSHPNRGMGYGLLRYLSENIEIRRGLQAMPAPAVGLNYWGQVDEYFTGLIEPSAESPGRHRSDAGMRPRILDVLGFVAADQLTLVWTYSENLHLASTAKAMAEATVTELQWLLAPDNPGQEPAVAQLVDESRPMESDGRWRLPTAASSAQKPSGAGA
jgi:non-ribosomal peptide synthase protein (TIGR01720 family)